LPRLVRRLSRPATFRRHAACLIVIGVTALILPAEIGAAVPTDGSGPRFVLGWSWQLPFNVLIGEGSFGERTFRHRVVAGVDWLPDT
jgi:hypothetical protein